MKKVILSLAIIAALTVVSCKQTTDTTETSTDSTAVQVDSVKVDSTKVDSVKVVTPTTTPAATPAN